MFASRIDVLLFSKFKLQLTQYVTIVEPHIRAIWALEALRANASDVWVFFAAIAATLKEIFDKPEDDTGIPCEVAKEVIGIFNDRHDEFFMETELYFTAFCLDPRMHDFFSCWVHLYNADMWIMDPM